MYDMHELTAANRSLPLPTWVEFTNLANGKRVVVKVNDRGPFVGKRLIDLSFAAATELDIVENGTARVEVHALPGPPSETTTAGRHDKRETTASNTTPPSAARSSPLPAEKPRPESSQRAAERAPPPVKPQTTAPQEKAAQTPKTAQAAKPASTAKPAEAPLPPGPPAPAKPEGADSERLFAQAGRFRTRDDAVEVVNDLKAEGFLNAFVVTEDGHRKSMHRVRVGPLRDDAEVASMNDRLRGLGAKRSRTVAMQ